MGKHGVLLHETQSLIVGNAGAIMIAMVSGLEPILPMSGTALDLLAQSGEEHKQLVVAVTTIKVSNRHELTPVARAIQRCGCLRTRAHVTPLSAAPSLLRRPLGTDSLLAPHISLFSLALLHLSGLLSPRAPCLPLLSWRRTQPHPP